MFKDRRRHVEELCKYLVLCKYMECCKHTGR